MLLLTFLVHASFSTLRTVTVGHHSMLASFKIMMTCAQCWSEQVRSVLSSIAIHLSAIVGAALNIEDKAERTALNYCFIMGRHDLAAQMLTLSPLCNAAKHAYRPLFTKDGKHFFVSLTNRKRGLTVPGNASADIQRVSGQRITDVIQDSPPLPIQQNRKA